MKKYKTLVAILIFIFVPSSGIFISNIVVQLVFNVVFLVVGVWLLVSSIKDIPDKTKSRAVIFLLLGTFILGIVISVINSL